MRSVRCCSEIVTLFRILIENERISAKHITLKSDALRVVDGVPAEHSRSRRPRLGSHRSSIAFLRSKSNADVFHRRGAERGQR